MLIKKKKKNYVFQMYCWYSWFSGSNTDAIVRANYKPETDKLSLSEKNNVYQFDKLSILVEKYSFT